MAAHGLAAGEEKEEKRQAQRVDARFICVAPTFSILLYMIESASRQSVTEKRLICRSDGR